MKSIFCFLLILVHNLNAYNQNLKINKFKDWTNENPGKLIPIRIEFDENVDCFKLHHFKTYS